MYGDVTGIYKQQYYQKKDHFGVPESGLYRNYVATEDWEMVSFKWILGHPISRSLQGT